MRTRCTWWGYPRSESPGIHAGVRLAAGNLELAAVPKMGEAVDAYDPLGLQYQRVDYEAAEASGEPTLTAFLLPWDFAREEAFFGMRLRTLDADALEACSLFLSSERVLPQGAESREEMRGCFALSMRERQRYDIIGEALRH